MPYQYLTIYFMSGTGNSYRAATWMAEEAVAKGAEARVIPIEGGHLRDGADNLVGLVMPTHGFTAPWHMLRFVQRLPRRQGTHAFVVPVRGTLRTGPFFLPGFEGSAGYLPALVLALKGYKVRGVQGLDMPASWTVVHSAMGADDVRVVLARGRAKVSRFMERILSGKTLFRGFPLLMGLALLPISIAYLLMGRFFFAKLFFASFRCNSCGLCARNCPVGAIRMQGNPPRPYWGFTCESCMRCRSYCPEKAVEASYTLAVAFYYLTSIPAIVYLLDRLSGACLSRSYLNSGLVPWLLEYPFKLLAIYLAYLLFNQLVRIPALNRFFTYTTLTHYYTRYHEPATSLRDIVAKRETAGD